MINVLFIHQSAELYGSDKTLLILLKELDKSKILPIVVLPEIGPLSVELEKEQIEVIVAPVLKLHRNIFKPSNLFKFIKDFFKGIKVLNKILKTKKIDSVYSNTLAVLLGFLASKWLKIPHTWHVHEIIESPSFITSFYRLLLNNKTNELVLFNSKATQEFWKINSNNVVVWNGIEPFSSLIFEESSSKKSIKIALVGRISRWKGQQLLLDAFYNLQKDEFDIELFFVGSAPPNQEHFLMDLQTKISGLNLDNKVKIIPFQRDIETIWRSIDIAVVPSTEPEPFGMVAIEAMMAGKPVIGANHGGLKEIIIPDETGLLFKPNDQKDLESCLKKLIENQKLREELGKNGLQRAINVFSVKNYAKTIEDLLLKV
jgi:glycosyltransferase involved in cell wall biosynthesis